jgi:hypothetical protein
MYLYASTTKRFSTLCSSTGRGKHLLSVSHWQFINAIIRDGGPLHHAGVAARRRRPLVVRAKDVYIKGLNVL